MPKAFELSIPNSGSDAKQVSELRNLLVIDSGYTFEAIRQRQLEHSVTCRDIDGFFTHVWSVHPFATLLTSDEWGPRYGRPSTYPLNERHTFIEGKVGRVAWLKRLFPLNFLLSQIDLFFALRRLIRREKINLIRVSSPLYVGLFGLALARSTGIPLVVRVGGNHDKFFETSGKPIEPRLMRSRKVEKIVERFVFSRADLVAGANQDNLDFALANGAQPERSALFRYGNLVDRRHFVEPSQREPRNQMLRELGIERGKFLLYVGRLEPIKQPQDVLEVLAHLRLAGLEIKAVLAGDGTMREELWAHVKRLGIEDSVVMPGNVNQGRLSVLYPAAAVVVSPHTGRALSEAALGAAAVVAYDVDWQSEIVETGVTGILVPHGDREALKNAALALVADPEYAKKLGRNIRQRALAMLDEQALNEHERNVYRKLLAR